MKESKRAEVPRREFSPQSAPFLYCNECGMQKVADMTPPLRPNDGFVARGSISFSESFLCRPPVKLMRRRISWFDFAPEAASLGDCAMVCRSLLRSWVKYDGLSPLVPEAYSPRWMPGVTGTFVTDKRSPG